MKTKLFTLICCFCVFATSVYAQDTCRFVPDATLFSGYEREGKFVEIPARCGGAVGLPVGMIAGLPFAILAAPFGKFEETYYTVGGELIPQGTSFITGLPFYLTKKVVYDFPKSLSREIQSR